jgi:hypothetical protein
MGLMQSTRLFSTRIVRATVVLAVVLSGAAAWADESTDRAATASSTNGGVIMTVAILSPGRDPNVAPAPLPRSFSAIPVHTPSWNQSRIPPTFGERLDDLHDSTVTMMQNAFDRVDGWFAMPGNESLPAVQCPFFVGLESEFINRGDGIETLYDINFDMKLRLPNFERRLRLFVTTEPLDEFVAGDTAVADPTEENARPELLAGLRRQLDDLFNVSVGVKSGTPPELFGALKWSRRWQPGDWTVRPSLKGYWTTEEGFGASGGLLLERWKGPWLLRSASGIKVGEKIDDVRWSETVTLGYAQELIKDRRFGSLAAARDLGRGGGLGGVVEGHGEETDAYGVNLFYRLPLRGKWLYLHVSPEVRWTAERDWAMDYGIRVGFDFVFSLLCAEPGDD